MFRGVVGDSCLFLFWYVGVLEGWTASVSSGRDDIGTWLDSVVYVRAWAYIVGAEKLGEMNLQLCGLVPFCFQSGRQDKLGSSKIAGTPRWRSRLPDLPSKSPPPPHPSTRSQTQPRGPSPPCSDQKHQTEIPTAPPSLQTRRKPRSRSRAGPRSLSAVARDTASPPVPRCEIL